MENWFDRRYGEGAGEEYDGQIPSIRELLEIIGGGVQGRGGINMPEARLDRIERALGEDIENLLRGERFSPSLNILIMAKMFALVVGGRRVEERYLTRYEKSLEKHNKDSSKGFLY